MNNTAIRAYRNVDTSSLIVFITSCTYINQSSSLSTANTLGLTSDADRAAANTYLDKVSASLGQEHKALTVYNITGTNLYILTKILMDVLQGNSLPLREALRGVNAQHISTSLQQGRHTLCIVTSVNTSTNDITLVAVNQLQLMLLVIGIVLAEYHITETLILIHQWQHIQLVFPDNIISLSQAGISAGINQFLKWSHKLLGRSLQAHTGYTIITAGNNTQQLAGRSTVLSYSHSRVASLFFQCQNLSNSCFRSNIGIAVYEAGLEVLYPCYHSCLFLNTLGTIDKGNAALTSQCYCHAVIRYRLHDSRGHWNVHGNLWFLTLFKLYQWSLQGNICRNALIRRITRYQKVLAKGMRWFTEIECQLNPYFL